MPALQVTLFSDGRPGHEKQSRGIVEALKDYVEVELDEIAVLRHHLLADFGRHISYFLHLGLGFDSIIREDTDLIIGAGSRTHLPMLHAARKTKARVLTCMTPAAYLLDKFDLCCVPFHDQAGSADNIFYTVGPPAIPIGMVNHDPAKNLVLIGGEDERSHIWKSAGLVADLNRLILRSGRSSWLISTSPRTPDSTEKLIQKALADFEHVRFVPFSQTGPGWVEEQYRSHATVWVTGDSISMVYEALSAGCKVGVLPIQWKKKDNKFQRSLNYLLEEKLIISLNQYLQGEETWSKHEPLNEADRCAKEILRRWWPTSLQ